MGVWPAHQDLHTDDLLQLVKLGLVVQQQLPGLDRLAQILFQFQAVIGLKLQAGQIEGDAVASVRLGLIHRGIGMAQDLLGILALLGEDHHADTGGDM